MNNQPFDFWTNIFELGKVLAPWGTVGVVMYNAINKLFKYFSDAREAELREMIKAEMKPKLDDLNNKIDKLTDKINEISYHLKDRS